ncbi:MAG: penicillin-binding protein 2 [Actinomycetota bacterium]
MTEDQEVYADWDALRLAVPAFFAVAILAIVGFFGVRSLTGGGDETAGAAGAEVDQQSGDGEDAGGRPVVLTPEEATARVLSGFVPRIETGRFDGQLFAFSDATEANEDFATITGRLGEFQLVAQAGPVTIEDSANASAPVTLLWTLEDGVQFETVGEIDMVLIGTDWLVDWEPAIIEESLDPGDSFVRERVVPPRAPILGRNESVLVGNRPVYDIGVIPRQAGDIEALSQQLGALLGEDPAAINATISPMPSDSLVSIATRRAEELQSVQARLAAIPGVVLTESGFPLTENERFARALLGRSAEVTAEIIEESPDYFIAGDIAGRSGLQRQYNERLAGLPGFQIRVDRRFPAGTTPRTTVVEGEDGPEVIDPDVVYLDPPVPGTPLQLTIDPRIQTAAENALGATELPSALVAIEASTGHILAVANGPGAAVNNFAMNGQYAPGSIFKIVTAYAALENGLQLQDPVDCPLTLNVNGRDFTNAEGEVLGVVPFRRNFVLSCNTAFINVGNTLDPSEFTTAAAALGIGVPYNLGTASYPGSVPTPGGAVDRAATAFGQGQTLVSPLSAAVMVASVASGSYRQPTLILDTDGEDDTPNPGEDPDTADFVEQPLNQTVANDLRTIMRAVVTNGTGRAVAGVPGGPVSGKTGTAEFGNQDPPQAHAWFVGFQGDIAFAVFVEGGEFGGATAAPIAGSFLSQLAGG